MTIPTPSELSEMKKRSPRYSHRDDCESLVHFMDHMSAMTSENLFHKGDIAAELAWRDEMIDRLIAAVEELMKQRDQAGEINNKSLAAPPTTEEKP